MWVGTHQDREYDAIPRVLQRGREHTSLSKRDVTEWLTTHEHNIDGSSYHANFGHRRVESKEQLVNGLTDPRLSYFLKLDCRDCSRGQAR